MRGGGRTAGLNRDKEILAAPGDVQSQYAHMICRMWHGRTPRAKADAYASFLVQRAIPDYRSVKGNIDVAILRRDEGEITHFLTVTHWQSEEAIRAFAGEELLKAKYYPEDELFLLEFEPTVQHFVVTAIQGAGVSVVG
jgi:heme-degrading monooxygenase HmoA